MFSPSLVTYTFYKDSVNRKSRESSIYELSSLGTNSDKILNLSKSIGAFNFVYGGDSTSVPVCTDSNLEVGEKLLSHNKIDVYCAGRISNREKAEWYYKGDALGIALVLAEKIGVKIESSELNEALSKITSSKYEDKVILEGFEKHDFVDLFFKCKEQGYDFNFLNEFESKYSNDIKEGFLKRLFN